MRITKKKIKEICHKAGREPKFHKLLGYGYHNINYLVDTDKGKVVLRIQNNSQFNNLKKEYNFLKRTNGKYGPKVFLFDDSESIIPEKYLLEEFIEGEHPKKINKKFLESLGEYYKGLHKNIRRVKKKIRPSKIFRDYAEPLYLKYSNLLEKSLKSKLDKYYRDTKRILESNENIFLGLKFLSLSHGDPGMGNIFLGKEIKMIDWEFTDYRVIEEDITSFVWMNNLNDEQTKLFLGAYGYGKRREKFNLMMIIHLWNMIGWRLERLNILSEKASNPFQKLNSKRELIKEIKENIPKLRKYINLVSENQN